MPDELMNRPTIADAYVRRRAAEIIFPKVWRHLGGEHSGCKQEDVMRDLMKVARSHASGFELAKDLERLGWCTGDSLVDILADSWVQDAIDELTDQWVRCLNIRPQFAVGDRVAPVTGYRRGDEGTVVRVDERLARYGVHFDEMEKNSWYTFYFEDIGAVAPVAEAVRQ